MASKLPVASVSWPPNVRFYAPVIVLRPGQTLDAEALVDRCRERMAAFKRPRGYRSVSESELPRTATGKIQHRVLKERVARGSVADSR